MNRSPRVLRRIICVPALAAALLAASAAAASAHVTVSSTDASRGGYAVITFRVPDEEASANTVGLTVQLPTDTPLASVQVQPVAGWTWSAPEQPLATPVTTDDGQVTSAVTQITWTATAGGIAPGEFQQFQVAAGPLPDRDTLTFKAIQTYSDGREVDWIETSAAGSSAEPEHPAPVLHLAAPADDGTSATPSVAVARSNDTSGSSGLAVTGVVLGGVAVLLALAALGVVLRRRPARDA